MKQSVIDRLEAMPTAALSRAQKGLRELLAYYDGGEMRRGLKANCPLCDVTKVEHQCPWYIFTGQDCLRGAVDWASKNGIEVPVGTWAMVYLKGDRVPAWVKHRKRQIKSWMAQIAKEIESR